MCRVCLVWARRAWRQACSAASSGPRRYWRGPATRRRRPAVICKAGKRRAGVRRFEAGVDVEAHVCAIVAALLTWLAPGTPHRARAWYERTAARCKCEHERASSWHRCGVDGVQGQRCQQHWLARVWSRARAMCDALMASSSDALCTQLRVMWSVDGTRVCLQCHLEC